MRMHRLVGIAYWASLEFMLTWYSASVSTPAVQKKKRFGNLSPAEYIQQQKSKTGYPGYVTKKGDRTPTSMKRGSIVPAVHLRSGTPQAQTSQTKQQAGLQLPAVSHIYIYQG